MGVVTNGDVPISRKEFDLSHDAHAHEHAANDKAVETALASVDKLATIHTQSHSREHDAHQREHALHTDFHTTEHQMTQRALEKADSTLERRLEGMNEFRDQLERQSGNFVTRETHETFVKERTEKLDTALATINEKYDSLLNAVVNRHEADMEATRNQIQSEREYRKTFEGSVNTWKWIATFLGASGVAGVILMFATR